MRPHLPRLSRAPRLLAVAVAMLLIAGALAAATEGSRDGGTDQVDAGGGRRSDDHWERRPGEPVRVDGAATDADDATGTTTTAADGSTGGGAPPATGAPGTGPPSTDADPPEPVSRTLLSSKAAAPIEVAAGVPTGHYTITVVLEASGGRGQVTVAGQRVAEAGVTGARTMTPLVWIAGPSERVGVRSIPPPGGDVRPLTVAAMRLDPAPATFTTRGTTVVGPDGRPVVLGGVNSYALGRTSAGDHFKEADIAAMRSWGSTIVRVQLGQHLLVPGMCEHDASYLTRIDERVRWITERGMVALLDLHWATNGDPCGTPRLARAPDRHSLTFWQIVAARYKDNPLVAFDLFNEPNDISSHVWRNGGTVSFKNSPLGPTISFKAVGMQTLYDAVRKTGARNLITVSGTGWATDLRPHVTHPLDGWGIAPGLHVYCLPCGGALPRDLDAKVDAAAARLPVVVTEFGWNEDSGSFNANVISWARGRGFGWIAFAWAAAPASGYGLLRDWSGTPSRLGQPVRAALDG